MGEDGQDQQNGTASPTASDPKDDGIIIAPIKVIIPGVMSDDDSEEEERPVVKKKKKKKKKAAAALDQAEEKKLDKTMMLTKTFGQAIRLINEQKVRFMAFCLISQIDVWSLLDARSRGAAGLINLISVFLQSNFQHCCFRHEKSKRPDKRRFG